MKKYLVLISFLLFLVVAFIAYQIQNPFFQIFLISISTTFFAVAVAILVVNIYMEKSKRKDAIASLFGLANNSMIQFHNNILDQAWTQFGKSEYNDIVNSFFDSNYDIKVLKPNDRTKLFDAFKVKRDEFINYSNELENTLSELTNLVGWDLDSDLLLFTLEARQSIRNFKNVRLNDTDESRENFVTALMSIDVDVGLAREKLKDLGKVNID